MRKLSITLLLIGISFMTMEANNYSTDHKTRIYFKKWNERQKTVIFLPIEATIEENNIEVQFFEKSNEPATFQVKDKAGMLSSYCYKSKNLIYIMPFIMFLFL